MYEKVLSQNLYLPKRYIYINYIYREHKCMNMYWMRTSCLKSYTCESVLSENQPRLGHNGVKIGEDIATGFGVINLTDRRRGWFSDKSLSQV